MDSRDDERQLARKIMKLSIIIPSYKDPLLNNTMQSILDNFETDYEIIPVIDGYDPPELVKHPRIKPIILKENGGMRNAINTGVEASTGKYLMRADEHIMFCKGYDKICLLYTSPSPRDRS